MTATRPEPRDHVAAMAAYALSKADIPAGIAPVLLNQNESCQPPSPRAVEAAAAVVAVAHRYSDPTWRDLRSAIAGVHGIDAENILIGAGSMELIGAVVAAYAGPGDEVVSTAHEYAFFRTAAERAQARYVAAPEVARTVSVDTILAAVTPATRIVCIANPGNPTGTRIGRVEVERLRDGLPAGVLLILDEAYAEFADHLGEPMLDLHERGDTIVFRTFSKAYGLAGMRVGWAACAPALVEEVRKLLNPNNVSAASQAGAAAAMRDQAYMRQICAATAAARDGFAAACRAAGLATDESFTNFVLIDFGDAARASAADRFLRARGIVLRPMGAYGLGDCLRASIGSPKEMERAADTLRAFLATEDAK